MRARMNPTGTATRRGLAGSVRVPALLDHLQLCTLSRVVLAMKLNGGKGETQGVTLWFTGLPCSGKTTVSELVLERLQRAAAKVELLDGDTVRRSLSRGLGFSRQDRTKTYDVSALCVTCLRATASPLSLRQSHRTAPCATKSALRSACSLKSMSIAPWKCACSGMSKVCTGGLLPEK
jgi:hypothetical protein